MTKRLIIAEKPSVATDIARVLGGFVKHDDYFESSEFVLSSAIGHLVEIAAPEAYEVKRGKWSFAHLPVIPPHFDLRPIEKTEARLKLLTRLIRRKDVAGLVNACDAGREGELIFNYIVQHAKSAKPIERLWLQSMTPQSIRDGFARLRGDVEMHGLRDAAMCRSESDWLVGINGTRAMTAFNSKAGGFHLTTVGRVQTPTLSIVVEREERIRKFVARDYWEVHGTFSSGSGDYKGRWFDEKFRKNEDDEHQRAERIWDAAKARAIHDKCVGRRAQVEEESKPSSQICPQLFDLTSLQREANGRFGFSAKATLGLAQALYEKHKVLTYPRTDSRALPEDYVETASSTLSMFAEQASIKGADHALLDRYSRFAARVLAEKWVRPNKRVFNNAKISDHFAIIPTGLAPKHLTEPEQKIYDLVAKRFLAIFFPAAEYLVTTRISRVEGEAFKTEGKILVEPGWLAVYGRDSAGDDDAPRLTPLVAGKPVTAAAVEVVANQTRPPARFNEATLLAAMEGAGKLIDDEELREAMREKGLGTPATRAQIIENLIGENYVHREGRELVPTAKAFQLLTALRGLKIDALCSPELTGNWEYRLKQMEHGELARGAFMAEIAEMTRRVVDQIRAHQDDDILGDFVELASPCPRCGGVIKENYKKFQCQGCDYSLWKIVSGRQYEPAEIEELLVKGSIGPLTGFRSKLGRPFAALIRLNADKLPEFVFDGAGQGGDGDEEVVDFSGQESVGTCPKCSGAVYERGTAYVCERSVGAGRSCDFRTGAVILQQPIPREQVMKLLGSGRTDLLRGFVSARTKRKFSAFLVRGADGKVGFEFEARASKEPKGKGKAPESGAVRGGKKAAA